MTKENLNVEAVKASLEFKLPQYILDKKKRTNRKKLYLDPKDIEQIKNAKTDKHTPIKVSRKTEIIAEFVGRKFEIHNGKTYITRTVDSDMVGFKFGAFAETRKMVVHPAKKGLADMKKKKGAKK